MTETEARQLYIRLVNSFPADARGVAAETWLEVLQKLDAGVAGTVIVRLRDMFDKPPTIHQFLTKYAELDSQADHAAAVKHSCYRCGGSGWITDPPLEPGQTGYVTARPCPCPHGRQANIVHAKIDEHRRHHEQGPYRPTFTQTAHGWEQVDHTESAHAQAAPITDLDLFHQEEPTP